MRQMLGTIKKFDSKEHSVYDSKGKTAMMNFLNRKLAEYNLKTIENPNQYGIDLLTVNSNNKVVHCWEIEVRYGNWRGDVPFPFSEINCIERKDYQWRRDEEFVKKIPYEMLDKYKVSYVQLNAECTRAVIIDGDIILEYPLKQWANRKSDGEYVRQVPIKKTVQVRLQLNGRTGPCQGSDASSILASRSTKENIMVMRKRTVVEVNKAQCALCDDVIESTHRHDFVSCKCGEIFVDGGKAYLRRGAKNFLNFIDLSESHEEEYESQF